MSFKELLTHIETLDKVQKAILIMKIAEGLLDEEEFELFEKEISNIRI